MEGDSEKDAPIGPETRKTLLETIPPTDPAILERMKERRVEFKHYAAMGKVAANWSFFESTVDTWSMKLAEVHFRTGLCFTTQIAGIGRKLDAFIALARLRDLPSNMPNKLCKFAGLAQGLSERRNRVIHDVWFFEHPSLPERLEVTAKKKLRVESFPTTSEELIKFADEIDNFRENFEELAKLVISFPRTWPKTTP